ncbi:MAG: sugar phosphate isomerase/epimerase family protein [Acutalibacteraceae bacterium]
MIKPIMGIQLYTLRDHIRNAEAFDATLARLRDLGVTDVQISAIGDFPAEDQAAVLAKNGMKVCVTHKPFERMKTDLDAMIAEHKTIGCDAMGIGSAPTESRDSQDAVRTFIAEATEIGKKLRDNGMTFNYHNHDFEFKKPDDCGDSMMNMLLSETDPETFHFIPDVAWIHFAGADPVELLHKMQGRVKVLHFKDYILDENGERHFVSLGKGVVDLKACYEAACALDIPYIMYEQDNDWVDGDPFKAVEESWAFMQSLQK